MTQAAKDYIDGLREKAPISEVSNSIILSRTPSAVANGPSRRR